MKNKLLVFTLLVGVLLSLMSNAAFAAENELNARFSYDGDKAYLTVSGTTKATYGQHINIVCYAPNGENFSIDAVKDGNTGKIVKDPAAVFPLDDLSDVLRIFEAVADRDGSFTATVPVSDGVNDGMYIMVQAAGGGSTPVSFSLIRQYKTASTLKNELLPAFEKATANELGELLKENELILGIDLNSEYEKNKTRLCNLFVSVREDDFEGFESLNDVLSAWQSAEYLLKLADNPTAAYAEEFFTSYADLIGYDFSENNKDYTEMANEVCAAAAGIFGAEPPTSMKNVKEAAEQSVALAAINAKDSTEMTETIEKYAAVLGIDVDDYKDACEKYSEYEVNKAFVGQDFENAEQVSDAFVTRVNALKGGSGGGGGSSPSSSHSSSWITKDTVTPQNTEKSGKYNDITAEHWAFEAIEALSEKGIINGFSDGSFKPDETVTREQLVKMLVLAFEIEGDAKCDFDDVSNDRWSAPYIGKAMSLGIVNGVSERLFAPENIVTREDAACMLYRICTVKGINLSGEAEIADTEQVADYAKESVKALAGAKIINGFSDGSFKPKDALTRGQAAKLIYSLMNR